MDFLETDNYVKITPPGDITFESIEDFQSALQRAYETGKRDVVLDLVSISHLQSRAISIILNYQQQLKSNNGALSLLNANKSIRELLANVNLDKMFRFYATEEEFMLEFGNWELDTKVFQAASLFRFSEASEDDTISFKLSGMFNKLQDTHKFSQKLEEATDKYLHIRLDLSDVSIIDSTVYGQLFLSAQKLHKKGGSFTLYQPNELVREVLDELNADKIFQVEFKTEN